MNTIDRPLIFSPQQNDIFDWIKTGHGSAVVIAVAGAGKTTTIVEGCGYMHGHIAFAAYNKKIADEVGAKLLKRFGPSPTRRAGTFHSFGFSAWRGVYKGVKVIKNSHEKNDEIAQLL